MTGEPVPAWRVMTDAQVRRWEEVLDNLAGLVPSGTATVVVDGAASPPAVGAAAPPADGAPAHPAVVADRFAAALHAAGRPAIRLTDAAPLADEDTWRADHTAGTVALADGPRWRSRPPDGHWDVVVWLRTPSAPDGGAQDADIVIDLHDPSWPVIRHVAARLADRDRWHLTESRAFFAARAATWDAKFGDDLPAYVRAIGEARLAPGGVVVDAGCGTGRALPALRTAVRGSGAVIGLDITPQMLAVARDRARAAHATLLLADARRLPFADASVDAVFAAGLVTHLPDPDAGLREWARVTRTGGRLVLFHPTGRVALAARRGRTLRPDEPLAEGPLRVSTGRTGWRLDTYDDPAHRFLATATRA